MKQYQNSTLPYPSSGYPPTPESTYNSGASHAAPACQPRASPSHSSEYRRNTPDSETMSPNIEYKALDRSSDRYGTMHHDYRREHDSRNGSQSPSDRKSSLTEWPVRDPTLDNTKMDPDHIAFSGSKVDNTVQLPPFSTLLKAVDSSPRPSHEQSPHAQAPTPTRYWNGPGLPPPHYSNHWDYHMHSSHSSPHAPSNYYGAHQSAGYPPALHSSHPGSSPTGSHHGSRPRPRYNKEYTPEQIHFCLYTFIDKKLNWQDTLERYHARFPDDQNRGTAGLQGVMYRENKSFPVTDEEGRLVWDSQKDKWMTRDLPIRQQNEKIGLLGRYPDAALEYDWVDYHDKQSIRRIGETQRQQRLDAIAYQRMKNGQVSSNRHAGDYASQVHGYQP